MKQLLDSIARALETENWFGAVSSALTLPDVAAWADGQPYGGKRYKEWFNLYVGPRYKIAAHAGQAEHVLLSGADCWALRCAWLHSGTDDITEQSAQQALERFIVVAPAPGAPTNHRGHVMQTLVLDAGAFCRDLMDGVDLWYAERGSEPDVRARLDRMARVHQLPLYFDGSTWSGANGPDL